MQRRFVVADPRDMLCTAFFKLQDCGCHSLPVVEDGRVLGILTADRLADELMIQESWPRAQRPHITTRKPQLVAGARSH